MDSDKAGVMAVGDVVDLLEARVNEKGVLRIRFSGGWVSEKTAAGAVCFEDVATSAPAAAAPPAPPPDLSSSNDTTLQSEPEPEPEAALEAISVGAQAVELSAAHADLMQLSKEELIQRLIAAEARVAQAPTSSEASAGQ